MSFDISLHTLLTQYDNIKANRRVVEVITISGNSTGGKFELVELKQISKLI